MARRLDKLKRSIRKRLAWWPAASASAGPTRADLDLKRLAELYEGMAATCHRLESRLATQQAQLDDLGRSRDRAASVPASAGQTLADTDVKRLAELYEGMAATCHRLESRLATQQAQLDDLGRGGDRAAAVPVPAADEPSRSHAAVVEQRDALLNERDRLLKLVQTLQRDRPLGRSAPAVRLPFPAAILADGTPPRIAIVDIGAQMLDSEDHVYRPLLAAATSEVIGFEPLKSGADRRVQQEGGIRMLNYVIGRGGPGQFHVNDFDPTSSLRPANLDFLSRFDSLAEMCRTVSAYDVVTTRLDDVTEIDDCDYLKIDVQGCTLDVLSGGEQVLARTVALHCEVEFAEVYRDEALFGEVDAFLRARGFELMDIVATGYATARSLPRPIAQSRLLWGDAVYLRAPAAFTGLAPEKALRAAFIAHVNYGMYDAAGSILVQHDLAHGTNLAETYGQALASATAV